MMFLRVMRSLLHYALCFFNALSRAVLHCLLYSTAQKKYSKINNIATATALFLRWHFLLNLINGITSSCFVHKHSIIGNKWKVHPNQILADLLSRFVKIRWGNGFRTPHLPSTTTVIWYHHIGLWWWSYHYMMIIIFSHDDHHNVISWSSYDDMIIISSYIFADVGLGCVGPARHCHPPVIGLKKSHSSLLFALHCRPTKHIDWVVVDKLSAAMRVWWETNTNQCKNLL